MRFRRPRTRGEATLINLTSLIDVVFLLLIFFMVSTSFALIQGIKVDLPTTTTTQEKIEQNIVISITKEGKIYLDKTQISKAELVKTLKRQIGEKKSLVVINADKDTRHGMVVEVMDLAKQGGAGKLGILTTPERR
ncbi:biopolymer transporter ExbD [Candidatus Aerophobetes bacterium]|uniref:Biopolymer transporter ExbD n=1 Tax=Aerophobetes bacterium TaxID=2030807 RepID=A0A523TEP7_UNCAE|nr:MAG: biopolymer transporter ExbD [Candidatus Aerophobetes bacterium]